MPSGRLYWFLREYVLKAPESGRKINTPVLLGLNLLTEYDGSRGPPSPAASPTRTNTALFVDPSARVLGRYDKQRLFPLTETSVLPNWASRALGREPTPELAKTRPFLTAGEAFQRPIEMFGHRVLVTICYEEAFHRDVWELGRLLTPDLLITLSSDSWFGDSDASSLHLMLARLRAVEHRKYFLRATTTGDTVLIAPTGEIEWRLPPRQYSAGTVQAHWMSGKTWYSRIGDGPWRLAAVVFVGMLVLPGRLVATLSQWIRRVNRAEGVRRGDTLSTGE